MRPVFGKIPMLALLLVPALLLAYGSAGPAVPGAKAGDFRSATFFVA